MSTQGSARDTSNSLSGLVSTLAPTALFAGVYFTIFLILRRSKRRWYAPRTYIGSLRETERTPELPGGLFNWFGTFWKIPDVYALQHQSLDAYLFLRFLRGLVTLCFVGACITWPVLFPVNVTGGGDETQLDILTYANVNKDTQGNRYYAHVFISWIYYGFVMYYIMRECIFYINLRQAVLLSPMYANRVSSRTVLFTSVPAPFLDEARLRKVFGDAVKNIWITADTTDLDELVKQRDKVALKLEKAEVKLIKLANKARAKALKAGGSAEEENKDQVPLDAESGTVASRWVPNKKRPSHRTGPLGLFGKKVDTINWSRTELERLIPAVEQAQHDYRNGVYKKVPGVFIEFRTQADAEAAAQVLAHHQGLHMSPRYIGIKPGEVLWKTLSISWWQRLIKGYAVTAFICALIIFWAIPVAFVGIVSNINYLKSKVPFLSFLDSVPSVIMGVITGLLPSVMLAILMSLVPVIMRLCAKLAGEPSLSRVELFTQKAYFAFQVVQVFLIATLTSSASAVAAQVARDPTQVTSLLSTNLPKASNFYINYFIVQGLGIGASVISQIVGFVIFSLLYKYLAGTPRAMYTKWANLSAISWGSVLPIYTNIAVIALTYAAIAPLVLGFATIGMSLFYLAYRYNILFVSNSQIDTRGLIYPRALKQLFTGIYLSEGCLIGLFAVSTAIGPLILQIAFLIFTVLFHISLNSALDPLLYNLPLSLLEEEGQNLINGSGAPANVDPKVEGANGAAPTSTKEPGILAKFLKPWIHQDYATLRQWVPSGYTDPQNLYSETIERDAYFPPSVTSPAPLLWIPEDPAGISKQEVAHTSKVIPITDEGAQLNEKGDLVWDRETTRPPLWEEKVYY